MLPTGPGNPPEVWVLPTKTDRFGSLPIQKPDTLILGGPNSDPYPSTRGLCHDWRDLSGPISVSAFCVFLFMVAFIYPTVNCTILTLVYHWLFEMYWLPVYSKRGETPFQHNSKTERQQSVNDFKSCKSSNWNVIWSMLAKIDILAAFIGNKQCCTLPAPFWKRPSTECQQYLVLHPGQ